MNLITENSYLDYIVYVYQQKPYLNTFSFLTPFMLALLPCKASYIFA